MEVGRKKAPLGEYRVIRGNGEDVTAVSQIYIDEFADIAIRYGSLKSGRTD